MQVNQNAEVIAGAPAAERRVSGIRNNFACTSPRSLY